MLYKSPALVAGKVAWDTRTRTRFPHAQRQFAPVARISVVVACQTRKNCHYQSSLYFANPRLSLHYNANDFAKAVTKTLIGRGVGVEYFYVPVLPSDFLF